jgi:uncharacterized protein (TIGR02001 family)
LQGGADIGWGILYAGVWASKVDFADAPPANAEVDWYGGIKPVWNSGHFGDVTFDFGVIYYSYPGSDPAASIGGPHDDPNYVEFKAGYSWSSLHPSLVTGSTVFYSPEYTLGTGPVWTLESFAVWTLPKWGVVTPVLNGLVGWQKGDGDEGYNVSANLVNPDDEYYYWNAGLNLGVENISFDFRYWDTNIGSDAGGLCAIASLCESKFVFTVKAVVP